MKSKYEIEKEIHQLIDEKERLLTKAMFTASGYEYNQSMVQACKIRDKICSLRQQMKYAPNKFIKLS